MRLCFNPTEKSSKLLIAHNKASRVEISDGIESYSGFALRFEPWLFDGWIRPGILVIGVNMTRRVVNPVNPIRAEPIIE